MAKKRTEFADVVRQVAPIVLGVLLVAFIISALFTRTPDQAGVYFGLTIVALFLTVSFAGLLAAALYGRRRVWRLYAILLGATVGVWIAGALLQTYLPPIQL